MVKTTLVTTVSVALALAVAFATGRDGMAFAGVPVTLVCVAIAFAIQWVAFVPSYLLRTETAYDLIGSISYLATLWFAVMAAGAWQLRSLLVAAAVSLWTLRLGVFLFLRIRKDGKDGRFDDIKTDAGRFFVAWTLQGLWVYLTLAAALTVVVQTQDVPLGLRDALGLGLWAAGFAIEGIADRQKSVFRAVHPGRFIDTGLWAWSRHPNYFGEIVLWSGIALVASSTLHSWQWLALISPLFVTVLLTRISGIPMVEKRADARWGHDPAYRSYKRGTPVLLPWPPGQSTKPGL